MVQYSPARLDRVFHALSDRTRRAILARLTSGASTVTSLAAPFPVSLNAVSKHIRVLERAGLVARKVRGREHHCTLDPGPLRTAAEWIAWYERFWEERLDALEFFLTGRNAPSTGSRHAKPRRRRRR